jgi:hypothetical protein
VGPHSGRRGLEIVVGYLVACSSVLVVEHDGFIMHAPPSRRKTLASRRP